VNTRELARAREAILVGLPTKKHGNWRFRINSLLVGEGVLFVRGNCIFLLDWVKEERFIIVI